MKVSKIAFLLLICALFFAGVAWGGNATSDMFSSPSPSNAPTEAWQQVAAAGVGDTDNQIIVTMQRFGNNLYAGTSNPADGASVLRSPDGNTWNAVQTAGFTDVNNHNIYNLTEYDGQLYAATGDNGSQAELWRSQTGNNGTWQEVANAGLGANQGAYRSVLTYQNLLWTGTANSAGANAQLWTYDSGTTNWTQRPIPGFDADGVNDAIQSMVEFNGDLYLGTQNAMTGAEVWRYDGDNSNSWQRVAQNGFGTLANEAIYTMRMYNGVLYVGTLNNGTGAELYATQDGTTWEKVFDGGFDNPANVAIWNLIEANGYLYLATQNATGGRVYRTTDGQSWTPVSLGGFGDMNNTRVWGMSVFDSVSGLHLYAGTRNAANGAQIWRTELPQPEESWQQVERAGFDDDMNNSIIWDYVEFGGALYAAVENANGAQVWRSTDGRSWVQVGTDGFGNVNHVSAYSLVVHNNQLYVGTRNANGGAVYRLENNGAQWTQVNLPGFGDANNDAVYSLISFNNSLYAGTENLTDRAEVWRYTGTGTNWTNVSPPDGQFEANNDAIGSMIVYNNNLYIGTFNVNGGEIWRTSNGSTWTAIDTDGQGDAGNDRIWSIYPFGGNLYVGYLNFTTGGQIWRSQDGQTGWTQVNQSGFGRNAVDDAENRVISAMGEWNGYLYAATENIVTGGEVWRTSVGTTQADWEQVNTDGFSFQNNQAIWALEMFNHHLYGGTANTTTGAEVWRTRRPDQGPTDPCCEVVKVGIEVQAAAWIRVDGVNSSPVRAPQSGVYDIPLPGTGTYTINVEYVEGNQGKIQPITAQVFADGSVQVTHQPVTVSRSPNEAWSQVAGAAEIGAANTIIIDMQQFGIYLYGSTQNAAGASIVRSPDGVTWNSVVAGGFGVAANTSILDMVEYDGQLYAGTNQPGGQAELYRSASGNSGTWSEVVNSGLGADQEAYLSLLNYNDPIVGREILWVGGGTSNTDTAQLWYYDSTTSNWNQEPIPGFDVDTDSSGFGDNTDIYSMIEYQGDLYIGVANATSGSEIWRRSASDGSWSKVIQNGFGDANNQIIYSMTVYNNVLYVGAANSVTGAELYATRDGDSWEQIFDGGFDDPTNTVIWRLMESNGYLYLATQNATGGRVYRTVDGHTWTPASLPGFGNAGNIRIWGMGTLNDINGDTYLYAGASNAGGAQIWRTIVPQPEVSWQQVERAGIDDDANNDAIWSTVEYDGAIYVGTRNMLNGGQVWKSKDGRTWVKVGYDGLDGTVSNTTIHALTVHNNQLYAGLETGNDARVYRWNSSNSTWEQINTNGFGSANNDAVLAMASYNGSLYAGTLNGTRAQVFRYSGTGTNWTNVSPPNGTFEAANLGNWAMYVYGSNLYLGTQNATGGEIWRYNGTTWTAITTDGFGDANNHRIEAFTEFDGNLYAGLENATDGGEVWRSPTGDNGSWQQVNQNGFGRNLVDDTDNDAIIALTVWQSKLYAATYNPSTGSEVWVTNSGAAQTDWQQVNTDGFGYQNNRAIRTALLGFGDHIYAGTENVATGAEIWRTSLPGIASGRFAQAVNVTLRTNQATTINVSGQSTASYNVPARGLYKLALPSTGLYQVSATCGQNLVIALDAPLVTQLTINAISDQTVNQAFPLTVNALDNNGAAIAITGTVVLSDSTGTISPTTINFSNQSSATVNVTIGVTMTDVVITGTYNAIVATSNQFDVILPPTATPTPTNTATPTVTNTPTEGPSPTPTSTVTPGGPTFTPTSTPTSTVTPGGPTLTPTATPTMTPSGGFSLYLPITIR